MVEIAYYPTHQRQMSLRKSKNCIRVPSDITLTPRMLVAAMRKASNKDIGTVIDLLIDELDLRFGDPDFESEPCEAEPEQPDTVKQSHQLVAGF